MNKKLAYKLGGVVVLMAIAVYVYFQDQKVSSLPLNDFAIEDTASVDRVLIQTFVGNNIDLKRKADHWTLNDSLIAKEYAVNRVLQVFHDAKVRNEVSDSLNKTLMGLLNSNYRKVSVYQNGTWVKTWYLSTNTRDSYATHVLLEMPNEGRSSKFYEVHIPSFRGVLDASFFISAADWKSQKMWAYHPSEVRQIKMQYLDEPAESFVIDYDGKNDFKLSDLNGNELIPDTSILKGYLIEFKKAFHNGVEMELTPEQKEAVKLKEPFGILEILDENGVKKSLVMTRKDRPGGDLVVNGEVKYTYDPNQFFGRLNGSDLLRLQYYHMDKFLMKRSFLEK